MVLPHDSMDIHMFNKVKMTVNNKQTNKYFIIPRHYTVYKGSKHQTNTSNIEIDDSS